jgi:hypothetical protein
LRLIKYCWLHSQTSITSACGTWKFYDDLHLRTFAKMHTEALKCKCARWSIHQSTPDTALPFFLMLEYRIFETTAQMDWIYIWWIEPPHCIKSWGAKECKAP